MGTAEHGIPTLIEKLKEYVVGFLRRINYVNALMDAVVTLAIYFSWNSIIGDFVRITLWQSFFVQWICGFLVFYWVRRTALDPGGDSKKLCGCDAEADFATAYSLIVLLLDDINGVESPDIDYDKVRETAVDFINRPELAFHVNELLDDRDRKCASNPDHLVSELFSRMTNGGNQNEGN